MVVKPLVHVFQVWRPVKLDPSGSVSWRVGVVTCLSRNPNTRGPMVKYESGLIETPKPV